MVKAETKKKNENDLRESVIFAKWFVVQGAGQVFTALGEMYSQSAGCVHADPGQCTSPSRIPGEFLL